MSASPGLTVAEVLVAATAAQSLVWMVVVAVVGRAFGLEARRAQWGWIRLFSVSVGGMPVGVGLLPFSSWVAFAGSDPEAAEVDHAGPGRRDWRDTPVATRGLVEVLSWVLTVNVGSAVLGFEAWGAFARGFPQLLSAFTGGGSQLAAELVQRAAAGFDVALVALVAVKFSALNALGVGVRYAIALLRRGPQGEQQAGYAYFLVLWGLSATWVVLIARAV